MADLESLLGAALRELEAGLRGQDAPPAPPPASPDPPAPVGDPGPPTAAPPRAARSRARFSGEERRSRQRRRGRDLRAAFDAKYADPEALRAHMSEIGARSAAARKANVERLRSEVERLRSHIAAERRFMLNVADALVEAEEAPTLESATATVASVRRRIERRISAPNGL